MANAKARIERAFEQSGHFFYKHAKMTLAVIFAFIALLALQIPRITVDTSAEALLHKNDPDRMDFNEFRDQFGRSEVVIIGARGGEVFSPEFFEKLRSLTEDLEENVPYIKEVTSLINVRNTRGEADELIVEDLTEEWPESPEDFAALKKRVQQNPLYINHVISRDLKTAAIVIETEAVVAEGAAKGDDAFDVFDEGFSADSEDAFDAFDSGAAQESGEKPELRYFSNEENLQVDKAVKEIVARHETRDFDLVYSGGPAIAVVFNKAVMDDTRLCMMLAMMSSMLFLVLIFRRVSGVFYPSFIVWAALICTMGLFPVFGVPFKLTASIIPAFLVAVGVADSVHILAIFYRRLNEGASQEDAIAYSLGHSGLAIVMTSMTTAAGLLSFSMAELTALAELGVFAAIGVMLALTFTLTMLPAMLAVFPIRAAKAQSRQTMLMDRFLLFFAKISTARPWLVVIVSMALMAVSASFLHDLVFSDNIVEYLPDSTEAKHHILDLDQRLDGVLTLEAVVDFGQAEALYEPANMDKLQAFCQKVEPFELKGLHVGKIISILDVVREINQALHENDPAYYSIPDSRQAIAQELLLFENSGADDLEKVTDTRFSKARVTFKAPWEDSVVYEAFIREIWRVYHEVFDGDSVQLTVTGETALMAKTIPAALRSMTKSYAIAFVVITIMMIWLVGHVKTGVVSMFPNLLPIVLVMGVIAHSGITLNLNTLMIGSIAIGLVVDDTMHFMYNFRRYFDSGMDPEKAVRHTMLGTGRALLITSLVLCSGFLVLLAASLSTSIQFGIFTAMIILLALLADFVLAPALMVLLTRKEHQARLALQESEETHV
ncbi:patched family protein [Desulfatibacillum aliphaticivorans]|uniref:Patched family protein n=1 Tax=Desulfatibacillum aliphaticivorans TaxID=218208 RepID=B8FFW5_DESAL|nr:efflux RND transporter permease subunit [Desulfatibacillum aliphaticivorans]ACL03520.1 patched family protein [Desulfatibacillum aliphaticivorans]